MLRSFLFLLLTSAFILYEFVFLYDHKSWNWCCFWTFFCVAGQQDVVHDSVSSANFDPQVVFHYGVPSSASILAFDHFQNLLAIGTLWVFIGCVYWLWVGTTRSFHVFCLIGILRSNDIEMENSFVKQQSIFDVIGTSWWNNTLRTLSCYCYWRAFCMFWNIIFNYVSFFLTIHNFIIPLLWRLRVISLDVGIFLFLFRILQ